MLECDTPSVCLVFVHMQLLCMYGIRASLPRFRVFDTVAGLDIVRLWHWRSSSCCAHHFSGLDALLGTDGCRMCVYFGQRSYILEGKVKTKFRLLGSAHKRTF